MITLAAYRGRAAGVFGLGIAGEAAVAALLSGGADVYAWDDGEKGRAALREKFPAAKLLPLSEWPWEQLAAMVLSPGVPYTHPAPHEAVKRAQAAGVEIVGDVELLYRACPEALYIGITGTNGKSTTTSLVSHILTQAGRNVQVGGNLGVPALALQPLGKDGIYVLEMSSYQLDLLRSVRFNVAALLNLTPDHLDRHGDMEGYLRAKLHIFERQRQGDVAVVAVDDEYTQGMRREALGIGVRLVEVSAHHSLEKGVHVEEGVIHDNFFPLPDAFCLMPIRDITTLPGRHNWQNAAVAYAIARACGLTPAQILAGMQSFPGLAHRMEMIRTLSGVRYINDSKATNADATANALAPYDAIYWILGGKPKAGGIGSLSDYFPKIRHAFLIGEASEEFSRTLGSVPHTQCGTLDKAVAAAAALAEIEGISGAVVLLSPACASFDQFRNFEERGDCFRALVNALNGDSPHARSAHAS